MTIDHPHEVPVRHIGLGAVMIGDEPVAPAGAVTLDVFGATLDFDPSRPDQLPSCLVADPGLAVPVLEQLYGDEVADEVLNRALAQDHEVVRCRAARQPSLITLTRLAEVRWCQRNAALPLDPALLLMEEMTLIAELRGIVETEENWVGELHRLLGALMGRPRAMCAALKQPAVRALLIDALDELASESPLTGEERADALGWLGEVEGAVSPPALGEGLVDWLEHLRPELALAAGGSAAAGTSTVDWRDVPLGMTSRREGNVAWNAEFGRDAVDVSASAEGAGGAFRLLGEQPTLTGGLFFDLVGDDWPMPLATGELTSDDDGGEWRGAVTLGGEQTELLRRLLRDGSRLDVRVRGADPEPMGDSLAAEAQRWCARAVCALRLRNVVASENLLGSAESALERAADLWQLAGREAELAATRELLGRAQDPGLIWADTLTVAETILLAERG
ncbi:hypothetical protein [Tessaracoccus sp. OH4464_COT-324]|uniref:hypothetical protein n=1 Tax=Tessaracoccus sp. OH4464_COT-324 TaxID=2491059 RepID=UPI000F635B76|nr:hypothetical protein [Tessaracoccus sp. OH4464_COT-324]RRD45186.1 hypothetical protein EII42_11690 [Tessaracoccus sp. OH4464_COT-324]